MRRRRGALPPGPAAAACSTLLLLLVLVLASGAVAQEAEPPADASLAIGSPARAEQTLSTPHDDAGPGEEAMLSATLSAAPSAAAPQAALDTAGARAMLDSHNQYRARHQADSLVWSSGLAGQAAQYAAKCAFTPDPDSPAGENLYLTTLSVDVQTAVQAAVRLWGRGAEDYDFANPTYDPSCGAFTQMIWRGSRTLGCAAQRCTRGVSGANWREGLLIICRYSPAGNVMGAFAGNVKPPKTSPPAAPRPPFVRHPPVFRPRPPHGRPPPGPAPPPPGPPPQRPPPIEDVLPPRTRLTSPDCTSSLDGQYWVCMLSNANIVMYMGNQVVWSSNTTGRSPYGPYTLIKLLNGTVIAVDARGYVYWSSRPRSTLDSTELREEIGSIADDGDVADGSVADGSAADADGGAEDGGAEDGADAGQP